MAKQILRKLLESGEFIIAPGVFDLISAKIADASAAKVLYMTGYGTVASYLGLPDAGLATYTDMLNRVERMVQGVSKPLIADADTGYGGLLNVHHTVRGYEAAGASEIRAGRPGISQEVRTYPEPTSDSDRRHGAKDPGSVRFTYLNRLHHRCAY